MDTPQNMKFILVAAHEADSRIFKLLLENRKKITALEGEEVVNAQILKACENTALKAIEFENEDLLDEAKNKMKKHYPAMANNFALSWDMAYCKAAGDCKEYLKAANSYAKKEVKGDPKELLSLAQKIQGSFPKDTKAQKQAESLAEQAAEKGDSYLYPFYYASILFENGKTTEALAVAKQSLTMAEAENAKGDVQKIKQFIEKIEG